MQELTPQEGRSKSIWTRCNRLALTEKSASSQYRPLPRQHERNALGDYGDMFRQLLAGMISSLQIWWWSMATFPRVGRSNATAG